MTTTNLLDRTAFLHGSLTQQVEYLPFKERVECSNHSRPTKAFKAVILTKVNRFFLGLRQKEGSTGSTRVYGVYAKKRGKSSGKHFRRCSSSLPAKYANAQPVIFKVPETVGPTLNEFHLSVKAFGDSVIADKTKHSPLKKYLMLCNL